MFVFVCLIVCIVSLCVGFSGCRCVDALWLWCGLAVVLLFCRCSLLVALCCG